MTSVSTASLPDVTGDLSAFRDVDVIALDVDGTLLHGTASEVAERFVQLHRLLATHRFPVDFVLVTGRPWAGVRAVVRAFEAAAARRAPHVVHFGSVVTDRAGNGALHRTSIPATVVREVADVYRSHGLAPSIIECRDDLAETHWNVGGKDPAATYDFGVPIRTVDRVPRAVDAQAVLASTSAAVAAGVLADLGGLGAGLPMEYHAPSGILYVDSPGASKSDGLTAALAQLGASPERTVAVGDSEPDIAMFRTARIGVAVGSADAAVIDAADFVCRAGPSDAVIELLEVVHAARGLAPATRTGVPGVR